jgi:hypothetical protein
MRKKGSKNNLIKLMVIMLLMALVASSATPLMIKSYNKIEESKVYDSFNPPFSALDEPIYEWIDNFDNEQLIESSMSYDYVLSGGKAEIKSTWPIWTDISWTKMVTITLNNKKGLTLYDHAIHLNVGYDSDMKENFADVRFKHENTPTQWLSQWIENYDDNDAEIWVHIPVIPAGTSTLYMFYGNPSAEKESNFYAVFDEWEEEWPNDEKLSYHIYTEGAWDPDVCFGNNKFLIVWEEGTAPYPPYTFYFKQDIRGSIYDVSGTPIKEDFTIRSGQEPQWHHENPSVAYGGGTFFVAWEHYYTSTDPHSMNIKARLVSTSGSVGNDIVICDAEDVQADPMVKFDNKNNRFCVVWEDARGGTTNYNIYGKLYDTSGNPVGGEKNICVESNSQFEPWVAFDSENEQYMVVYEEKKGDFEMDIYGQLFNKDLNPVGNRFIVADGSSSTRYLYPCVEYSEEADRYLVTYNSATPSKPFRGSIYGKTYTPSGELRSSALIKQGENFVRTDIAPYLETAFLVCFNGGGKIWGRFITVDGEIETYDEMGDIQLSASASAEADWVNVASDENEIFVTWEDTRIDYAAPFDGMSDAYGNIWHLNIGDSSEVTASFGSEQQMILSAQITSKEITPENLFKWDEFTAVFDGTITFDVLKSDGSIISGFEHINSGRDLSSINEDTIRLRVHLTRTKPSTTPTLDQWKVTYLGKDEEPPRTHLDYIEGDKGLNDWYIEESVIIWLHAYDLPEQTGSGVDTTYYTIDNGKTQEYNPDGGIHLDATQSSNWMGYWDVNFWSVDIAGNIENNNNPENKISIKIDAEKPQIEITEPINEQEVEIPFWVRADASDNGVIDRVQFNIQIDGDWMDQPYVDDTPPYEWYCNEKRRIHPKALSQEDGSPTQQMGVNVMVRAEVIDESGQEDLHEIWVHITNWNIGKPSIIINGKQILNQLGIGLAIAGNVDIQIPAPQNADSVKFVADQFIRQNKFVEWDYDLSNGCQASFDIPTGFYIFTAEAYKEEVLITTYATITLIFISI